MANKVAPNGNEFGSGAAGAGAGADPDAGVKSEMAQEVNGLINPILSFRSNQIPPTLLRFPISLQ
jgi:hypothetical protein